jgi:hypothetical protein
MIWSVIGLLASGYPASATVSRGSGCRARGTAPGWRTMQNRYVGDRGDYLKLSTCGSCRQDTVSATRGGFPRRNPQRGRSAGQEHHAQETTRTYNAGAVPDRLSSAISPERRAQCRNGTLCCSASSERLCHRRCTSRSTILASCLLPAQRTYRCTASC